MQFVAQNQNCVINNNTQLSESCHHSSAVNWRALLSY